jgi:LemA protein
MLALAPILLLAGCGYNKLQGLDEEVKGAWAEVQNQYQRRADLVPMLVETVKGAAKFEQDTLNQVIEARSKATAVTVNPGDLSNAEAFRRFEEAQRGLSSALSRLLVVVERYPDLKVTQNFRDLQAQIEGVENRIAVARGRYAQKVVEYNTAVRSFPTNLTARFLLGLEPRENFRADDAAAKPPQIKF